jgi:hypothetical protein
MSLWNLDMCAFRDPIFLNWKKKYISTHWLNSLFNVIMLVKSNIYHACAVGALDLSGFLGEPMDAKDVRAKVPALAEFHGAEGTGIRPLAGVL